MPNDTQQQTTDLVNQYLDLHKQQDKLEEELKNLKKSVARVVGGYSEGSGFFVADNQILTSFHVIADEPSLINNNGDTLGYHIPGYTLTIFKAYLFENI